MENNNNNYNEKKMIFVILEIFPISENNGKYIKLYDIEKKKKLVQNHFGLLPNYIVKFFFLFAIHYIVLQRRNRLQKKKNFVLQDTWLGRTWCCNTNIVLQAGRVG